MRNSIYLDTSVPSAYFDERNPARQESTIAFWAEAARDYDLVYRRIRSRTNEPILWPSV